MANVNQGDSLPVSSVMRLEGKVAIITGGAAGIGAATARLFRRHGAKVMIADVQDELGLAVASEIGAAYVHCDVAVEEDVSKAVDLAVSKHGKLDVMFNNAGILDEHRSRITDVETSEFERVMRVNVTGVFLGTKHAARVMGPGGSIINNGSVGSAIGGVASHAYVASKHAVVGLTKNGAAELGRRGIRVNCISPFAIATSLATDFIEKNGKEIEEWIGGLANLKGAVLRAEDVAQAAVFFGSDESKYVSGHNFVLDGGFTTVNNAFGLFAENK